MVSGSYIDMAHSQMGIITLGGGGWGGGGGAENAERRRVGIYMFFVRLPLRCSSVPF